MDNMTKVFIFTVGAAFGSIVTWYYVKKKYEFIAQEEIDSVRETFANRYTKVDVDPESGAIREKAEQAKVKPDIVEYASLLHKHGYNAAESDSDETDNIDTPYVITPEEFGDLPEYETISLVYYADKILADDDCELVDDINETVGFESLGRFGEYEDDSVFVRNDRLRCDYEILLDQRKYEDVVRLRPHQLEE